MTWCLPSASDCLLVRKRIVSSTLSQHPICPLSSLLRPKTLMAKTKADHPFKRTISILRCDCLLPDERSPRWPSQLCQGREGYDPHEARGNRQPQGCVQQNPGSTYCPPKCCWYQVTVKWPDNRRELKGINLVSFSSWDRHLANLPDVKTNNEEVCNQFAPCLWARKIPALKVNKVLLSASSKVQLGSS